MSERASYFRLGVFTIVATALLVIGLTALGAGAFLKGGTKAETYLMESVDGLDVGPPVKHRGVIVGKVTAITFVGARYDFPPDAPHAVRVMESYVLIELTINEELEGVRMDKVALERAVKNGLRSRLTTAGLMGASYIELVFADENSPPPIQITWTPKLTRIPSLQSVRGQITTAVEGLARELSEADIGTIIKDIGGLVKSADKAVSSVDVDQLQADVRTLVADVRATNARLQAILGNPAIDATITSASNTMGSIEKLTTGGETDLAAFIKDLPAMTGKIKDAAAQVDALLTDEKTKLMLANINKIADASAPAAADLRLLIRRIDLLVATQQSDLEAIVLGLRRTVGNVEGITEDASKNPSRLLFGEPPAKLTPGRSGDRR